MAKTYAQIQQQITELQQEAERLRQKEVEGVVARIKEAISVYGLTPADLGFGKNERQQAQVTTKVAAKRVQKGASVREAKFKDQSGNVWSGRGPRPKWLKDALANGSQLSDFAV